MGNSRSPALQMRVQCWRVFHVKSSVGLRAKAGQSVAKICGKKESCARLARSSGPYLPALGVYGFGEIEPVKRAEILGHMLPGGNAWGAKSEASTDCRSLRVGPQNAARPVSLRLIE